MAQDYLTIYQRLVRRESSSITVSDEVPSWMKVA
jgi:hypothetical protein